MPSFFFASTVQTRSQFTEIFDFIWPTATAMWNLRARVAEYLSANPDATDPELKATFLQGSDINGSNLRRACVQHSWEQQQSAFARTLLVNVIAIFEAWIEETLESIGKNTGTTAKELQYPTNPLTGAGGAMQAISQLAGVESTLLKSNFYDALRRNREVDASRVDALLVCYRYFKELRNCELHYGGVAGQRLIAAQNRLLAIRQPDQLGMTEIPQYYPAAIGSRIQLSLRGIVGLSHVVLKLISTFDAELSRVKNAEHAFLARWKSKHSLMITLPSNPTARQDRVARLAKSAGFPEPAKPGDLAPWLRSKRLVAF
jgi:hypothetical protein